MIIDSPKFDLSGPDALKTVFRNHASGIAVVTSSQDDGTPIGFTASSVASLGSNPPLISLNIAQGSSSYSHMCPGKLVAIHTLDADTLWLAQKMAADKSQRFSDVDFAVGPESTPIFPEASAVLLARVRLRTEVEANAVIILDVEQAASSKVATEPLVYFQRGYHKIGSRLQDNS